MKQRQRTKARGDIPNFKRFQRSLRSCFRTKCHRWYSSLVESINPSNVCSVIRRITGRKKETAKQSYPHRWNILHWNNCSIDYSVCFNHQWPSDLPSPCRQAFWHEPTWPQPSKFWFSKKISDEIIDRAVFKPSTVSSAGADGISGKVLRSVWSVPPVETSSTVSSYPHLPSALLHHSWNTYHTPTSQTQLTRLSPHLSAEPTGQDNRAPSFRAPEWRYPTPPATNLAVDQESSPSMLLGWPIISLIIMLQRNGRFLRRSWIGYYEGLRQGAHWNSLYEASNQFQVSLFVLHWLHSWLSDRTIAVRFQGSLGHPVSVLHGLPEGEGIWVMDYGSIFSGAHTVDQVYAALQARLHLFESWARYNRITFGVHKSWVASHKHGARLFTSLRKHCPSTARSDTGYEVHCLPTYRPPMESQGSLGRRRQYV